MFCCFTSQANSYGHCGTVSSPNHTFSWAGLNKRLTSNLCTYFRARTSLKRRTPVPIGSMGFHWTAGTDHSDKFFEVWPLWYRGSGVDKQSCPQSTINHACFLKDWFQFATQQWALVFISSSWLWALWLFFYISFLWWMFSLNLYYNCCILNQLAQLKPLDPPVCLIAITIWTSPRESLIF